MRIFGLPPVTDRRVGLLARNGLLGLAVASSSLALGRVNLLERSYNKYRTGADTAETVLTPANVKSTANLLHKQFVMKVDGKIEGSPLYASALAIAGGIHNVLYAATTHNTLWAIWLMSSSPILPIALVASIRTPRSSPRRPTPT